MPHLVRLYIRQVAIGFALAAAFVALLLGLNVANLWHLVSHVNGGWIAVLMLWVFNGIVFAGVQFALSLPRGHGEEHTGGKRDALPVLLAEPVPVRVSTARRARN
ncbi:MAG: hypothetical protein KDA73_07140 [Rhodobacteraceae bacterium]|nr:hypothetical protein [Paracoccaceae bacterium]